MFFRSSQSWLNHALRNCKYSVVLQAGRESVASIGQEDLEGLEKAPSTVWEWSEINEQNPASLNRAKEYAINSGGQETHFIM